VLVATVRALKMHGGKPLTEVDKPDMPALLRGLANLDKHLENVRTFGQPCVVAINQFRNDRADELAAIASHCESLGVTAIASKPFLEGGPGCIELATIVRDLVSRGDAGFRPLYDWNWPIERKIETIAREMYGAQAVEYAVRARHDREQLERGGFGNLPVCMAKTQQSLSDNPALLGRPRDFIVNVREIQLAAGAGFVVPITGEIMRMPGLPRVPTANLFDLTDEGEIVLQAADRPGS